MDFSERGYISEVEYIKPERTDIYPYNLDFLKSFDRLKLNDRVTFIVGENGAGKSSLIEAIAIAYGFNAEGGSVNFNFATVNSSSCLYKNMRLKRTLSRARDGYFLRAETFYNVASEIDLLDATPAASPKLIGAYGGRSLHEQSHGESFFSLMINRFGGNGFYILDEPEAALSPERQLALLIRIHELVNENSQFIIATHSPILLSYPYSTIYSISKDGIEKQNYEDTAQFALMKMFINDYKRVLHNMGID